MAAAVRYLDKEALIRAELMKCARAGETPSYREFGARVGIPPQGPWKPVLDKISREQTGQGLPDITFLLINKTTGYPGQIGFLRARKPTPEQKELARLKLQEVFEAFCPTARLPF
ncbi:hypothetical protein [Shumkonia mesophila]|uniref:hypothetical protein n=1 Tax=Shumkonia mesophila TaxID=2838854 RepID=UPI0029348AAC|nr:hypothetical protein [Shumkonia mesophila]